MEIVIAKFIPVSILFGNSTYNYVDDETKKKNKRTNTQTN